ncbi:hypothetical protein IMSHALPRED_003644 [Imshaugia aleurites]|uniref:F-box domain-containing protein n=1 Tax=Imshaugia aleurites TaxID=172621 RepID=A0A8H3J7V4_9LECA|nr:hypothetical protein IMSHALPRED_003644 [Imshaugia aleurites]
MADLISAQQLDELTYERQEIHRLSINLETLEQRCPLTQPSSVDGSNTASLQSLGQLDSLPLEIIQNVIQLLDLHTLILMQSLNHRSKLLVNSLPAHRDIVAHAPNALRAILSTGLASHFTIYDLYSALRSQECCMCGSFGAFLYLLSCRRCCWLCLAKASDILPISREFAAHSFGLSSKAVQQLPCMRTLPGRYTLSHEKHKRRIALVSTEAAKEAGMEIHKSEKAMEAYVTRPQVPERFARYTYRNQKAGALNEILMRNLRSVRRGHRAGWQFHDEIGYEPHRFMAAMRFPTLDLPNGIIEWGLSCKGCLDGPPNTDEDKDWEAMYTKRGYLAHFDQCKGSKDLLASMKTDGSKLSKTS